MTSGSTYFSSLDGIGSNIHVVGLDQWFQAWECQSSQRGHRSRYNLRLGWAIKQ